MKKSTVAMLVMWLAFGSSIILISKELAMGSLAGKAFIVIMTLLFFLVIFNKGIDRWLKSLDGK